MRIHPWWAILGILFIGMLVSSAIVIHYQLTAAWRLRWIDEQLEINTRFKTDEISSWLLPVRTTLPVTRWAETPITSPALTGSVDLTQLYTCCILPHSTAQDFQMQCPTHRSWYTHIAIKHDRQQVLADLKKAIKSGKFSNEWGKPVKTASGCIELIEHEHELLLNMLQEAQPYSRWTTLYQYTEYPQQWLFAILRCSYYARYIPIWAQKWINSTIDWWMNLQLPLWIHKAKTQTKQQTWRIFHGHVDRKIEKMAQQLREKIQQHGYVHDYWPYYACLVDSFDLQVKDIIVDIKRLIARNRELLACLHDLA
jgi:hypothetical protein